MNNAFDEARKSETEATPAKKKKPKAKSKARRGSGSVYKQKGADTYTIQFYVNGRRRRESTGSTDPQAAQQQLTQRLLQIHKGEPILSNKKLLVSELYEAVERDYRLQGRKSLTDLKGRWNNHLKAFFADMLAVAVSKEHVERYRDQRMQEGAKRASVNREVAVIRRAFYLAEERLPRLPVFPTKLAENNARTGFVDDVQFAKLTANVAVGELWLRCFLEIAYCWGWRYSEILGLRVRQVDLKQRVVRLDPGTTKSGAGREAPMNDRLYKLLAECCADKGQDDHVLTRDDKRGKHRVRDFRRRWEKLCEAAGLPNLIRHDFRRSAARNLRAAGVAESIIMEMCGWETDEVFRRYAIVAPEDKRRAMEKLDAQRAEDEAKRKATEAEKFSHSFSHNPPQNSATEVSRRKELTQ